MGFLSKIFGGGDAPDTSQINAAAAQNAATTAEQLAWAKQIYADGAGERAAATDRANRVADSSVASMDFATEESRRLSERNRNVFQPMEDRIVADANTYDTPGRRKGASDAAVAGVENQFGSSQDAMSRAMRRGTGGMGGRGMALMQDTGLAKAKASAGASTQAVNGVEQQGYARRMDAVGLGKGIVGNQATMQGIATQSGAGATAAGGQALTAMNSGMPMMQTAFQNAQQGNQITGNLYGQAAKLQAGDGGAGMMQGVGSLMQGFGALYAASSKKLKTDKRDIDEDEALEAVNESPVEGWDYKEGVADSGTHIGPYAEDVQKNTGEAAAPRGQMVSMTAMAKQNGGAIKALDKKFTQLIEELEELVAA